jgi:hypothetical protein
MIAVKRSKANIDMGSHQNFRSLRLSLNIAVRLMPLYIPDAAYGGQCPDMIVVRGLHALFIKHQITYVNNTRKDPSGLL